MKKRILWILFCALLCQAFSFPASAIKTNDSITVQFRQENKPVAGASFKIYQVAELNGDSYTLLSPFSQYSVYMPEDPHSGDWKILASTLEAYVKRDKIPPFSSGQTDENGKLLFSGLPDGLYLIIGDPFVMASGTFLPQPMLIGVPYSKDDGTIDYDVSVDLKYEVRSPQNTTLEWHVLKIWNDDGKESQRPKEIIVQLLCDGTVYDEQILNESNNWRFDWTGLDAAHEWKIVEKQVPEGYAVQIDQQGAAFTITNTKTPDKTTPTNETTTPPDKTTPSNKTITPPSKTTPSSAYTKTPPAAKLPKTGLLWWPVPVMAAAGAAALIAGTYLLLHKKDDPNA